MTACSWLCGHAAKRGVHLQNLAEDKAAILFPIAREFESLSRMHHNAVETEYSRFPILFTYISLGCHQLGIDLYTLLFITLAAVVPI